MTPMEPMTVRLLYPWDSSDKNAGVGFHALLQGILPDLGIEPKSPASPEWQADSLLLSHLGHPTCCMPTLILVALLIFSIQMKYALSLIYFFPNSFDNRNPEYYQDLFHLSGEGRRTYTKLFIEAVAESEEENNE